MELTLIEFVLTVIIGSCGFILLALVISRSMRGRAERRSLRRRIICRLCLHAFEARNSEPVVRCPECGVANEHQNLRRWN
ncbi:hypothetical protein JIN85_12255 [Luteolibacter pohnpeiensis]|uniref:Uncharacterized protein n=1 Tax=Luteolibacter pohnpeiensis TaxID=454153 RepID=A0A934VV45_9BACT|nr:hypothetical protein [Luteolibacter pohnpeiensis]MBK1883192.1 hypothetical protein [Luteolibacter pohnpeiensis]